MSKHDVCPGVVVRLLSSPRSLTPMRHLARVGLGVPALVLGLVLAAPAGATVYLAPSGSDSAPCTAAAPCRSMDRGYRVAPAGTDVEMAGGSYGSQTLGSEPAKGANVTFHP